MRFRNVATRIVGFASNSPWRPSLPCPGAPADPGYVKASNGAPLIVGEMVARDPACGERAFFVTAADDPSDVHPAKFDIVFNVKAKRVEAFGGNGAIPVTRRQDGSFSVPLTSCQGVLIILHFL